MSGVAFLLIACLVLFGAFAILAVISQTKLDRHHRNLLEHDEQTAREELGYDERLIHRFNDRRAS